MNRKQLAECSSVCVCVCLWMCWWEDKCRFPTLPVLLFSVLVEHRNRAVSLINMNNGTLVCFHCKLQKVMSALCTCPDTYCVCTCETKKRACVYVFCVLRGNTLCMADRAQIKLWSIIYFHICMGCMTLCGCVYVETMSRKWSMVCFFLCVCVCGRFIYNEGAGTVCPTPS